LRVSGIHQHLARVGRADDKRIHAGFVSGARAIRAEQFRPFPHPGSVRGDDSEPAAVIDIQMSEIKRKDMKNAAVDEQEFIVITDQIVRGASDDDARLKKAGFELAQVIGRRPG